MCVCEREREERICERERERKREREREREPLLGAILHNGRDRQGNTTVASPNCRNGSRREGEGGGHKEGEQPPNTPVHTPDRGTTTNRRMTDRCSLAKRRSGNDNFFGHEYCGGRMRKKGRRN